jgi:hypothetical protein
LLANARLGDALLPKLKLPVPALTPPGLPPAAIAVRSITAAQSIAQHLRRVDSWLGASHTPVPGGEEKVATAAAPAGEKEKLADDAPPASGADGEPLALADDANEKPVELGELKEKLEGGLLLAPCPPGAVPAGPAG